MAELKPCPFCGGKARTFEFSWHASQFGGHMFEKPYWQVICESCKAAIGDFDSKAEAIEAWNTRTVFVEDYGVEDGWRFVRCDDGTVYWKEEERTCRDVNGNPYDFTCSECGASMYTQVDECWTMVARGGRPDDVIENPSYCPNCGAKVVSE